MEKLKVRKASVFRILIFVVTSLAMLISPFVNAENIEVIEIILANPSFEDGKDFSPNSWTVHNETTATLKWDSSVSYKGKSSVSIEVPQGAPIGWPRWCQELPSPDGDVVLILSAYAKTQRVTSGHGAYIAIEYFDERGNRITFSQSAGLKGTVNWKLLSVIGGVPSETKRIRVNLLLHGNGKAWFDEVSLRASFGLKETKSEGVITLLRGEKVCENFMGFGVQNNPFLFTAVNYQVTEAQKHAVEEYMRFLKPRIVRVFLDTQWWDPSRNGRYVWDGEEMRALYRVLDLYREINASVNLVMWRPTDWTKAQLPQMIKAVADLLKHLVEEKGYDNVRFLTLYNEPDNEFNLSTETYVSMYRLMFDTMKISGLSIQLIGADTTQGGDWFFIDVLDGIKDMVAGFSYHEYIRYDSPVHGPLVHMEMQLRQVRGFAKDKPLVVWEFNIQGQGAGTFTPGRGTFGLLVLDEFQPALKLAEYVVGALRCGIAGMSYWEAYDMNYPGDNRMEYGLIASENGQWRLRPFFYAYQLFTRLIEPGASVFVVDADGSTEVSSVLIENPNGNRTLFIVNPTGSDLKLDVSAVVKDVDITSRWSLRVVSQEEIENATRSHLREAPAKTLSDRPREVVVSARSLVVLTTVPTQPAQSIVIIAGSKPDLSFTLAIIAIVIVIGVIAVFLYLYTGPGFKSRRPHQMHALYHHLSDNHFWHLELNTLISDSSRVTLCPLMPPSKFIASRAWMRWFHKTTNLSGWCSSLLSIG